MNNDLVVKNVDLLGDTVLAAKDTNGVVWVGVRWMCQGMGMTEGQYKRQITNIQKDELFNSSGANLVLNKGTGEREVFCIKNDYIPLWLAKITITQKTREENPELAEKLLNYQLKAKDILAEAFMPKQNTGSKSAMELLTLHYEAIKEVNSKVETLEEKFTNLENGMPAFYCDTKDIQSEVRKKAVDALGGADSNAYKDKSTRSCVFADIQMMLRREFGVRRYDEIKHKRVPEVIALICEYRPPLVLRERIDMVNAQQTLKF